MRAQLNNLPLMTVVLAVIFSILNMADYTLTYYGIQLGFVHEANPILSWMPIEGIGIAKVAGEVLLLKRFWNRYKIFMGACIVMALVVAWNVWTIYVKGGL